jgi:hypothetical protein
LVADDIDATPAFEVAARLVGGGVLDVSRVGRGRNSRVYRVNTSRGIFALKRYPSLRDDPRDRLATETKALQWMAEHGVDAIPRVIAVERASNCALLSWIEGSGVSEIGVADVDQAAAFLGALERLRRTFDFPAIQLDAEACLSGAEIERQIRARLSRLKGLENEPALRAFLDREFAGPFERRLSEARKQLSLADISFEEDLAQEKRTLVPSDFGFHNALRDGKGLLTFLDFEYFGWDDPAKLASDILLHPGTPMSEQMRLRFRTALERLYSGDRDFAARFGAFYPLFGLRWVLILLNEFHPERWRGRVLAGEKDGWRDAKERQLRSARAMLMNFQV